MKSESKAKRRILLIDDDTSLLVTLGDFLRYEGYDVTTAESAERGLKLLGKIRPDLIVLDMSMPGMGGRGFLEQIKGGDETLLYPVLVLTARATMAEYFAHTPVDGFIAKPCDPADLLMEVGRIIFLRSGSSLGRVVAPKATRPRILLGESDKERNDRLRQALGEAQYEVETVFSGPEVVEAAVVGKPDAILVHASLQGMGPDAITKVLRQIPGTASIPVLVFGMDEAGVSLDQVAALDECGVVMISASDTMDVLESTKSTLRET